MASEKPKQPNDLQEPYDWGNSDIQRSPITGWSSFGPNGTIQGTREHPQAHISRHIKQRTIPHPNVAAKMQTLGGKTVDQLAIPDLENPYRKWQPTNEQVLEELSLIAGPPAVDAEGNRIIGGALKEIDDTHAVLSEMPTLGFFRRNFITGRQDNPEYKKRNLEIDRRYLAERALYLLGYEPRGFRGKEITDAHLTTQIDRAFSLDNE